MEYLIEYTGVIGRHLGPDAAYPFQTMEGELPTSLEDACAEILEYADSSKFVQKIRVRTIEADVPPRDVTQEVLTKMIEDWDFIERPEGLTVFYQSSEIDVDEHRVLAHEDAEMTYEHELIESERLRTSHRPPSY